MGIVTEKVRQREQFNILMENWDRVKELTEESANAAGTADEKYTAYMDSMEAATKRLQNAWGGFTQSLETSFVMKSLTNATAVLIENMDKLKYLITYIATASSVKIFDFLNPNSGTEGGIKAIWQNIPILGRGSKTNSILEQINTNVEQIKGKELREEQQSKKATTRSGFLRNALGRGDVYDPETGKSISYKEAKAYSKLLKSTTGGTAVTDPQMNQFAELLKQRKAKNAAMGAVSAVLTNAFTTKQVGASGLGKLINTTDQTVEETEGDKLGRTLASGALAAIGGYFGGPLGAMIGQTVGEGAASIVSTIIHRSELEMKQRVADAKENISRLDAIKSTMETNSSIMTEEITSSEDYEKLYKYTDDLYEKLFELQYEGNVDIVAAINDAYDVFKGVGNITSIRDLCDEINNGNADQRSMIQRQLELAEAQVDFEELRASQEETRYEAEEKISGGFKVKSRDDNFITYFAQEVLEKYGIHQKSSWGGNTFWSEITDTYGFDDQTTPEEAYDKINEAIKALREEMPDGYEKAIKALKEFQSQIKEGVDSLKKQNKELILSGSRIGFFAADIHDLTTTELKDLTMDGVVGRVVEALETQGIEVRNAAGYIKDEYQDTIEGLIKSDSQFNVLQQADTKTLGQLTSAQERFSSMLEKQTELVAKYGKSWDKWYKAAKRGELSEEIAKIVYAANPERIEQFARAWNTTRKEVEKLTKEFPDLTTAIGLMSPSEIREYYSVFTDFFEDLAADSTLTAENLEKLIDQYPQLLKYYKNGTLSTELLGKVNEEQKIAYANAMLSAELSNSGISEEFLTAIKSVSMGEANEEAARFVNLTKESAKTILEEIGSVKSLNEVLDKANTLRQNGNEAAARALEELVEQYMNYEHTIEWTDPIYAMAQQGVIDKLTQEIENLNEQKDALSDVNDERQRELDLIKAKDALENAKKQKKRVYREGVGWSYEADESAISSAKENLENLNIEKQQEDLQYQIDQLEALKSILENLDEEKQKEANKKALEEYFGKDLSNFANPQFIEKLVKGFNDNNFSLNPTTGEVKNAKGETIGKINSIKDVEGSKSEQSNTAKTALVGGEDAEGKEVSGAFEDFKKAQEEFEGMSSDKIGTKEYRIAAKKYRNAKKDLEAKLSVAESVGVDKEIVGKGSSLLKGYQEPEKAEWILVDNLTNPDPLLLKNNVSRGSHNVMLTTKEMADANQFKKSQYTVVKTYDSSTGEWGNWKKISGNINELPDNSIVMNSDFDDAYAWVKNGQLYWIADANGNIKKDGTWHKSWATGTTSTPEGLSLINELGTEAIITPSGTLTALPSKAGIVPADITKNVWALGEIAPTLVSQLSSLNQKPIVGTQGSTTYEEGQYFDNFTMNVYPTKGDDFSKILEQARAQMRLTRHNN